jgi:hypothetical protein
MLGTFPQELSMKKKLWLAGLLAALVMFIWGSIVHTVLPIGEMYVSTTPGEDAILASMKANMNASGFYLVPGESMAKARTLPKDQQEAAMKDFQAKWTAGPRAVVVYNAGVMPGMGPLLAREFLATFMAALIMTIALVAALPNLRSFAARVLFVTALGLLPLLVVDISLWNWYQFPQAYLISETLDYVVGALLAGIFLAWFYRNEGAGLPSMAKAA